MVRLCLRTFIGLICLLPGLAWTGPVDVNRASASELAEALQGIGPRKAAAIVAYREQHGPYRNALDLVNVKGIGQKLIEQNKSLIRIGNVAPTAVKR